jgi:hypothetical protein
MALVIASAAASRRDLDGVRRFVGVYGGGFTDLDGVVEETASAGAQPLTSALSSACRYYLRGPVLGAR